MPITLVEPSMSDDTDVSNYLSYIGKYFNTSLYNLAVSSCVSEYTLKKDDKNIGASWVQTEKRNSKNKKDINFTCYVDQFDFKKIDFILMDCEGFEYFVLQGAYKAIRKFKPIIVMEINEGALNRQGKDFKSIESFLISENYIYRNIYHSHDMSGPQFDIICFPNAGAE